MPGTPELVEAWKQFRDAQPAYKKADKYYAGPIGQVFASERVKRLLAKGGINNLDDINYAHIPVDTIANRLDITTVTVAPAGGEESDDEQDDGKPSAEQVALDKLMEDNQLDAELDGLFRDTSKHGDGYLFVWPVTQDGSEKPVSVDIRVNDAESTRAIYDDEDPLLMKAVIRSWSITDKDPRTGKPVERVRANYAVDGRIERWISVIGKGDEKSLCEVGAWEPYTGDDKPAVIEHEWGLPYFHLRNDRPYGRPEHFFAYGAQQMINKLVYADAGAIDYQSFPQRYYLVDPAADQPMLNSTDPFHPDDAVDDPEDEDNESQLEASPSAVWKLYGAKSAGQFEPAAADVFLSRFDRYVQAMAESTETPLYRFGSHFTQTPSGEALRAADAPTVNRVENRRSRYGPVLTDALEAALRMLGFKDIRVLVSWKPAQQVTDSEGWKVVQQQIDAGVPRDIALVGTGNYTDNQVHGWLSEDTDSSLMRRVQNVLTLAQAAQALGAAVGLGVLDRELAAKAVQYALGEMAGNPDLADELMQADAPEEPEKGPDPAAMMKAMAAQQAAPPVGPDQGEQNPQGPPADSQAPEQIASAK
jgi:hypothetical protein